MKSGKLGLLILLGCGFLYFAAVPVVMAQTSAVKTEEELPQQGFLADSVNAGNGSVNIQGPWGGREAPLTASVSRLSADEWLIKVFNNSDATYRAGLRVIQMDDVGKRLRSLPVSATLEPGEVFERQIRTTPRTEHCAVELTSWKRFEKVKTQEEIQAEVEAKKAELDLLQQQLGGKNDFTESGADGSLDQQILDR